MPADATIVIKGGRVVDATGERVADVVIGDDGRIAAVGPDLDAAGDRARSTPAGCVVAPGLGRPPHATSASRARRRPRRSRPARGRPRSAASRAVVAMPNTTPAIDCAGVVREVLELGRRPRCATSARRGAITVGRAGEQLAPMAEMADARRAALHRRRHRACRTPGSCAGRSSTPRGLGVTLAQHCEDDGAGRRRPHARGGVVEPPRHPRPAGRGRGADGACATSPWPGSPAPGSTSSTCRPPARSSWCARPRPTACRSPPRPRPTTSRSPTPSAPATTRCSRSTRRCAPTPTSPRCAAGLADGTIDCHRHRPRPAHPGGQGGAVRPGAARDARPRDGAGPRAHRARPARSTQVLALLSWQPGGASLGVDDEHGGPVAEGRPANLVRDRPDRRPGRSTRPRWPAAAATRPTPAARSPAGSATRSCAASRSSSTARPSDDEPDVHDSESEAVTREALLVLADGTTFEGEADRRRAARRRRHRRGRVQHRAVRLPGGDHRPVLRRADHHLHLPAHRQLRRQPRRRREPPAVLPGRRRPRPGPAPQQLAQRRRPRRLPAPPRRPRHRRHRHPPPHPPHPRRRRHARRVRHRRRGRRSRPAAADEPGTDGVDLVAQVTTRRAVHGRRRPAPRSSPTTSASSARSCATSAGWPTVEVVPAVDARRRRAGPRARRRVPLQRPRRPRRGRLRRRRHRAGCSARCRSSASASATSCSAAALGGRHRTSCRSATTAATTRCATLATGRVEITSQNHNFAVDADSLAGGRGHPREPQRRRVEGLRCPSVPAFSVQYHPEAGPGPARRRATSSTSSPSLMDAARTSGSALMPRRDDIESILLIGAGPIVIGQACEFDYSGTQACRVLREEGYRVILANSNPATIMTDPEFADATYVEPLDVDDPRADHRAGAARRRAARPSAARPRSTSPWSSSSAGVLDAPRHVELIGANAEAIATAEDREQFKAGHAGDRPRRCPPSGIAHTHRRGAWRSSSDIGLPGRHPPRATSSAARAPASPPRPSEFERMAASTASTPARSARSSSSSRSPAGRSTSSRSCATGPTTA